ncbi:MAG TPA: LamG domain-containing protein, partial [Candidatus Cloacimonetes bacterium]|nr:LamG domain-containing protein [Candidatus Cloacimonadota bacterium]
MKKVYFLMILFWLPLMVLNAQGTGGYCLDYDGTDDYVEVPDSPTLNLGTGDFTISLWVNSSLSNDGVLIEKIWDARSSSGGNGWAIQLLSTGRFRFSIADTYGETPTDFNSIAGNNWNDGSWHHLSIVVDRSSNVNFYIDGNADRTGDVSSESGSLSNDYPLLIGINYNKNATKDFPFDGLIDEVRIWGTTLSQSTIQAWKNKNLDNSHPHWSALKGYWKFDDGSPGQTTADSSDNSNNGTLGSTTGIDANDPNWVDSDAPLPVILASFTAIYANGYSLLHWTTQSESNNQGWNIYRSETDLEDAVQINGFLINGAGTTTEPTEYEFSDEEDLIFNTTFNDWLESICFSGETVIHSPISRTIPEPGDNPDIPQIISDINNYPNPFSNNTEISFMMNEPANVKITIHNIKGQEIIQLYDGYCAEDQFST